MKMVDLEEGLHQVKQTNRPLMPYLHNKGQAFFQLRYVLGPPPEIQSNSAKAMYNTDD